MGGGESVKWEINTKKVTKKSIFSGYYVLSLFLQPTHKIVQIPVAWTVSSQLFLCLVPFIVHVDNRLLLCLQT